VNNLALEFFDFTGSTSLKNDGDPADYMRALLRNEDYRKVKITDANGVIIASTNPSEINLALLGDDAWGKAIGGDDIIEEINQTSGTATLYLPLSAHSNTVRGVVVLEASLPGNFLAVQKFTNVVLYIVFGASVIFVLTAYVTMYELEEKMEAKERSIFDQSRAQTEEKQLYEAITSSIVEALVVISKDKQIMMLNPEAEELFGRKSSEVEYRSYEKIINFYDENGKIIKKDPIADGLEKGRTIHISSKENYHLKGKNNTLIPISINIAPVAEGKSFVKGIAITIVDISTEKELQQVKDEFVYVVGQELGNPIFALDGYLNLLKGHSKSLKKEGREILEDTININQQLSSLVNDLLEVARNETGRLTFDLESIDVGKILADVLKASEFKSREKRVKIEFKKTTVLKAIGNEQKIREVCTNLIDNAIKYTPSGGKVLVEAFLHDKKIIVSVKDDGIGLTPDNKRHLFEKFFRVKNKATANISGTGLGLFIAKQIVEKCGGKIWATSEEDKGSTFYFSLKVAKN
jgi:PAS domain S-box-containing protein